MTIDFARRHGILRRIFTFETTQDTLKMKSIQSEGLHAGKSEFHAMKVGVWAKETQKPPKSTNQGQVYPALNQYKYGK